MWHAQLSVIRECHAAFYASPATQSRFESVHDSVKRGYKPSVSPALFLKIPAPAFFALTAGIF